MGSLSFPARVNVYDHDGQDDSVYEMQYLLDLARLGYGICNVAGVVIISQSICNRLIRGFFENDLSFRLHKIAKFMI